LSPKGQALAVPQAPVTAYIHKPLDIQGNLGTEAALYLVIVFNNLSKRIQFFLGKIINKPVGIDLGLGTDLIGTGSPNTKNVG
jgi:hypothetical protein